MRQFIRLLAVIIVVLICRFPCGFYANTVHDFSITDIKGAVIPLSDYEGHLLMLVNVASFCGFTAQYEELQAIYTRYYDRGFRIIGLPSNDFFQEPNSEIEIQRFCQNKYAVTFPLSQKIRVNGQNAHPLYQFLTREHGGRIKWNFTKFLIDKNGHVIDRFSPDTSPNDTSIIGVIEHYL
jgi:glutathione peroxidase